MGTGIPVPWAPWNAYAIHTRTRTWVRTRTRTYVDVGALVHGCVRTCMRTCRCVRTYVRWAPWQSYVSVYTHAYVGAYARVRVGAYASVRVGAIHTRRCHPYASVPSVHVGSVLRSSPMDCKKPGNWTQPDCNRPDHQPQLQPVEVGCRLQSSNLRDLLGLVVNRLQPVYNRTFGCPGSAGTIYDFYIL
jgi:hypothetical protein